MKQNFTFFTRLISTTYLHMYVFTCRLVRESFGKNKTKTRSHRKIRKLKENKSRKIKINQCKWYIHRVINQHFRRHLKIFLCGLCHYFSNKHTNNKCKVIKKRHCYVLCRYLKTLYPGGIRTRVSCCWGVCDVFCATLVQHFKNHWIRWLT
jgi:hypothetical protein